MFQLKATPEVDRNQDTKETPMNTFHATVGAMAETAWALGVSVTAGLLLLS